MGNIVGFLTRALLTGCAGFTARGLKKSNRVLRYLIMQLTTYELQWKNTASDLGSYIMPT